MQEPLAEYCFFHPRPLDFFHDLAIIEGHKYFLWSSFRHHIIKQQFQQDSWPNFCQRKPIHPSSFFFNFLYDDYQEVEPLSQVPSCCLLPLHSLEQRIEVAGTQSIEVVALRFLGTLLVGP